MSFYKTVILQALQRYSVTVEIFPLIALLETYIYIYKYKEYFGVFDRQNFHCNAVTL